MASGFAFENQESATRDEMNAWVARFAPLVMAPAPLEAADLRDRLELIEGLRRDSERLATSKSMLRGPQDDELVRTFEMALPQLSQIESDLRTRLARVAPGDPESRPDLDRLQERLHENAARQEMGLATDTVPEVLEAVTSVPSWVAAIGLLIPALGVGAFVTVHMLLMIGGMWMAFGPGALALVLFYAIFYAAVVAMFGGAFTAAAEETIRLSGTDLVITKRLGALKFERRHQIDPDQKVKEVEQSETNNRTRRFFEVIEMTDPTGRPIHFARGISNAKREDLVRQLNAYLAYQRTLRTESP
ncbi:hypothetical protein [Aphanothece stagnina]|uniref:hypothetical protein n=1 Tax=Aphanothece stagnina TaxID=1004305 RepID=UPI00398F4D24